MNKYEQKTKILFCEPFRVFGNDPFTGCLSVAIVSSE